MSTCTLYRGGEQAAELACGGRLPYRISGGMGRDELRTYLRYCPQCGGKLTVSDKAKPSEEKRGGK